MAKREAKNKKEQIKKTAAQKTVEAEQTRTAAAKIQMIEALQKSLGIVTSACKITGLSRTAHYEWLKDDPEYKAKVEDIQDIVLDLSESQLYKKVNAGDTIAILFHLKTKGKKRGYIEKVEVDNTHTMNTPVIIDFSGKTDNQSNT